MYDDYNEIRWICPKCGGHWSEPKGIIPCGDGKCTCGGTYVETRYTEGDIDNDFRYGNGDLVDKIKEEYVYPNEQYDPEEFQKWQDKRRGKEPFHSTYQSANKPKCPYCNSTNIKKISTLNRAVSIGTLGLLSGKIGKNYECLNCKAKW